MKISSLGVRKVNAFPVLSKNNYATSFTGAEDKKPSKLKKAVPYIVAASGIGLGVGAGLLIANKKQKLNLARIAEAGKEALGKAKEHLASEDGDMTKVWAAILALAGISGYNAGKMSQKDTQDVIDSLSRGQAPVQTAAYGAANQIGNIKNLQTNPNVNKYVDNFYGISLLTAPPSPDVKEVNYKAAIKTIQEMAHTKLNSKELLPVIEKEKPTLWSITSEFAPIKAGGLGVVPVDVRNNSVKLGIDMPTFVPMYLTNGISALTQQGDKATYKYKNATYDLDKVASFKMDVFKNGNPQSVNVELFLQEEGEGDPKRQLIFVKTDRYFDGAIYEANSKTEEPEKFAVMSKAIYEFAKLKMDGVKALKDVNIPNNGAIDKINAPDALILNDWQASPVAALARYKAPMESVYGELSEKTANALRDMRIITLGHNVMYQGSTLNNNDDTQRRVTTSNILNTLFDKYAYDIVRNADSGASASDPKDKGLKNLDNVLIMNLEDQSQNHTNLLNMGIVLSDYFHPVSQNYADELISPEHTDLSNELQWALVQKSKAGKLVGIINGNDFENLCIQAKRDIITKLTGLKFEEYEKTDLVDDIVRARQNNKVNMYQNYILPYTESSANTLEEIQKAKKVNPRLEFVKGTQGTELPVLTRQEILDTPILTSGGRLASQKGMPVLCGAIKLLFENWEKDFPGKNKPIFYIAGEDQEGGKQREIIETFKAKDLSKEDTNRVLFAHGFVPMAAMTAGSDFFMMSSMFEPCGLTQGESLALATPVIASAVGGIVDTINRDGKTNGVLTKKEKVLTKEAFYEALKEGLNIFFNDKEKYNQMVRDSLLEDFSWIQKDKKGPVFDYLETIGIQLEKLPEIKK